MSEYCTALGITKITIRFYFDKLSRQDQQKWGGEYHSFPICGNLEFFCKIISYHNCVLFLSFFFFLFYTPFMCFDCDLFLNQDLLFLFAIIFRIQQKQKHILIITMNCKINHNISLFFIYIFIYLFIYIFLYLI